MSTTIDNKIVEMSFNNSDFEKNAQQSIETTEKLKKSLDFDGVGKGLEQIGTSAKKIDLTPIADAASVVGEKFDTMKYIAIFALQDIYDMATRTASQIVSLFAVQPVSSGFEEYELKMGSIQTIMASTGESLTTVNGYLDELNLYADKTIYSFADMTNNIGKFTNAGVSLDKAVAAIQGISNEAAVSGANTNEASRAMYNFAQALSAGYVKLIDWKSIENANMATVEFKQQLIDTAEELGNLEKQADGTYKVLTQSTTGSSMDETISATQNFNDSLSYQWMTTDVLVNTLHDYADETTEIGKKAFAAATEVKTFSMMMDTLSEAAGSGWTESWETIVGDFEQAKKFWTKLTDYFSDVIDGMSTSRNELLKGGLENGFDLIEDKVESADIKVEDFEQKIKDLGNASGLAMDDIINDAGSMGQAFADGAISTDLITQAINELAVSAGLSEDKTKSLNKAASDMFDGLQAKSGRTLLQESLFNTLDAIKTVIESITGAWNNVEEGFTSSKLYNVITKINKATVDLKSYISENIADPWVDVQSAITDSGLSMDDFQSRLIAAGNQNGVDVQALIDEYGSLEECFAQNAISADLVTQAYENLATETTTTTKTVTKTIDNITDVLDDYQKVVDEVWNGDWKNAPYRYQLLADAGWDYQKVQALVNRTVDEHRLTLEDLNAVGIETTTVTEEQVEALNELADTARESGVSVNAALNKMGKKTGLRLAVESVHDAFVSLKSVASAAASSFGDVFADADLFKTLTDDAYSAVSYIKQQTGELANYVTSRFDAMKSTFSGLFDSIKTIAVAFYNSMKKILGDTSMYDDVKSALASAVSWINKQINKLTSYISSHGEEIEQTLTGVMKLGKSIAKDIAAVISGIVKVLAKLFDNVTDAAPDVLDITSNIGKFFEALAAGVDVSEQITKFFDGLVEKLPNVVNVIQNVWNALKDVPVVGQIITAGENIWAGIGDGAWEEIQKIESGEIDIQSAIVGVGETIVNAMATAAQYVKDNGIQGIIDVFKNGQISISEGLTGISGAVTEPSNEIVTGVNDFLDKLGQAAAAIAPIAGAFVVLKGVADTVTQFANVIKSLAGPIETATDLLKGCKDLVKALQTQITDLGKAIGFAIHTEAFINLAICIGIIAGVIVILAEVAKSNPEGMEQAIYAVVGIVAAMALVMAVISEMSTSQIEKIQKVSQAAMELAGMIAILAGIVVVLSMLDQAALIQGLVGLGAVLAMLAIFIGVIAFIGGKFGNAKVAVTFDKVAQTVLAIAVSFLIIAGAIKLMCTCDTEKLSLSTQIFSFFMVFLGVLMAAMAYISSNAAKATVFGNLMTKVGNSIKLIGEAFMFLGIGIFLIGQLSQEQLDRASTVMLAFAGFVTVLLIVCAIASKISAGQMATFSTTILSMVAAIGVMALLAIALGYVDPAKFVVGVGLLSLVTALCVAMYGVMMFISGKCNAEKMAKMGVTLLAMTVCIGIMAAIAVLLGYCDQTKLMQGIGFVSILVGLASVMALAASQIEKDDLVGIAALAAAVAILAVIAIAFTTLDPASLGVAVGALSTLMICFGIMGLCMSTLSKVKAPVAQVALLIAILASIGGIIFLLCSFTDVSQAQSVGIAIGAMMLSLAAMMYILSSMSTRMTLAGKQITQMLPIIGVAIGIMAACAILIAVVCAIGGSNTDQALQISAAIGVLMLTLAASLEAFSHIKSSSVSGQTVATLLLLVVALGLIGVLIGVLCNTIGDKISEAYAISAALALMLGALTTCVILLAKFGDGKTIDNNVVTSLGILVVALAVIGLVLGLMVANLPADKLASAYQASLALVIVLAGLTGCVIALSKLCGNAHIDEYILATLGVLSLCLLVIGPVLTNLVNGIGDKADAAIPAAAALAIALIGLTAAAVILTKFSANGVNSEGLGTTLVMLGVLTACLYVIGNVLATLISAVAPNVDAAIPAAAALAIALIGLAGAAVILSNYHGDFITGVQAVGVLSALVLAIVGVLGIIGGINQFLGGGLKQAVESAMDVFYAIAQGVGKIISGIGVGMSAALVDIMTNVSKAMLIMNMSCALVDESNINKIKLFGEALVALGTGQIVEAIGNFFGMDMTGITLTLTELGKGVAAFAKELTGVDTATVEQGGNAAKALCEALSNIPMEGGFLDQIFGTHNYDKFAEGVTAIGKALPTFVEAVGEINTDTVQPSCEALKTLMECLKNIPVTGGLLQDLMGDTDYTKFAEGVKSIGAALPAYVESVGDVSTENVQSSVDALQYLMERLKEMPYEGGLFDVFTGGQMNIGQFAEYLPKIGTALKDYCTNTSGGDWDGGKTAASTMSIICNSLKNIQTSGVNRDTVSGFQQAVQALNETDISKLSETYSSENTANVFDNIGTKLSEGLKNAIESVDFSGAGQTLSAKLSEGLSASISTDSGGSLSTLVSTMAQSLYNGESTQSFLTVGINLANYFKMGLQQGFNSTDGTGISASGIVTSLTTEIEMQSQSMVTAGTNLANWFKTGFSQAFTTLDSMSTSLNSLILTIGTYYTNFNTAGVNLGSAFKDGMRSSLADVTSSIDSIVASLWSMTPSFTAAGANAMGAYASGMIASVSLAAGHATEAASNALNALNNYAPFFSAPGTNAMFWYGLGIAIATTDANAGVTVVLNNIIQTLTDAASKFTIEGEKHSIDYAEGLESGADNAYNAALWVLAAACVGISTSTGTFFSAGLNAAYGFANGISAGSFAAVISASAMANAAASAAKAALAEHSPSKVFEQIGNYGGQGLAIGFDNTQNLVRESGTNLALSAVDGISDGLSDLNAAIIPTIDYASLATNTGKLDFSATMNRLISEPVRSSVDVMNDIGKEIKSSNNDVISAISDISKPSYTIEGITYDDGSAVARAISDITRYANIAKRR